METGAACWGGSGEWRHLGSRPGDRPTSRRCKILIQKPSEEERKPWPLWGPEWREELLESHKLVEGEEWLEKGKPKMLGKRTLPMKSSPEGDHNRMWGKGEKEVDRHACARLRKWQKGGWVFFFCRREKQLHLLTSLQIINSLFTRNVGFTVCTIVLWHWVVIVDTLILLCMYFILLGNCD